MTKCELCGRTAKLGRHHLVPRQKKGKDEKENIARFCITCCKQVHALFTNRELKQKYNTVNKLKRNPRVRKWINWVRKKQPKDIRYHGKGGFHQ